MIRWLLVDERTFLERFRDWDLDPADIWTWFLQWANYYFDTFGPLGWVIVILTVIVMGLSFDLTHSMTSLILAGLIRSVFSMVLMVVGFVLYLLFKVTGAGALARARDMTRFWVTRMRKESPGDNA